MKKFFNVLIAMCLLLSLGACTLSANTTINTPSTEISGNTNNNTQNGTPNNGTVDVEDLQSVIEETCLKLEDSVIGVTLKEVTYKNPTTPSLGTVEKNVSVGSGVIIKREEIKDNNDKFIAYKYYVVTNRHVVLEDATTSTVKFNIYAYLGNDDVEILADLVGYDAKVDVALITFNHSELIEPVKIGSSANLNKGSFAIAIGNPDGYDYYGSVTFGVISGPIRYIDVNTDDDEYNDFTASYIQHDVAINPGNSGGGLFDIHGNLNEINLAKMAESEELEDITVPDEMTPELDAAIDDGSDIIIDTIEDNDIEVTEETTESNPFATKVDDSPNRQLTEEEIAALFASL